MLRVGSIRSTLAASLIMGVAVTGMHYTGMTAMRVFATTGGIYGAGQGLVTSGEGAGGFVLPLVLGIGIFSFLALILIMLAPLEEEILADARLSERLAERPVSTAARAATAGDGRAWGLRWRPGSHPRHCLPLNDHQSESRQCLLGDHI